VYRSEELKKMEQKLRRVKTMSSSFEKETKIYERHLTEELRDLNLEGNNWIEMKMNTKIKQQWRRQNQNKMEG
jgi:hypothetical protein